MLPRRNVTGITQGLSQNYPARFYMILHSFTRLFMFYMLTWRQGLESYIFVLVRGRYRTKRVRDYGTVPYSYRNCPGCLLVLYEYEYSYGF